MQKNENIFNLAVPCLEKYRSTNYLTAAVMLTSGYPGLEIKSLSCCTLYSGGCTHVTMYARHVN